MSRDRDSVWDPTDDVQLLYADLIDLVQHVDTGDIGSVSLNHVN